MSWKQHKTNFKVEFNRFEFLLSFSYTGRHRKSALLFTHIRGKNRRMHTFPKEISAMKNTNSLVLDLKSVCHVHFLQR